MIAVSGNLAELPGRDKGFPTSGICNALHSASGCLQNAMQFANISKFWGNETFDQSIRGKLLYTSG
ncbi:hypothetical protein [Roseinatronobacter sp. S2]|uniref:hypothetical protein n=1 Tax=Roseinatronobacter sp. S2 TaxID=3035471 RepID=UPI00240F4A2E|nr:hypothetical protein [Roseinatronobacter sp. S2]WFE76068.1 hypothetical protein P8S53_06625 [Roseinatronobacter sp. S2]